VPRIFVSLVPDQCRGVSCRHVRPGPTIDSWRQAAAPRALSGPMSYGERRGP
jgi:hypothetical protein